MSVGVDLRPWARQPACPKPVLSSHEQAALDQRRLRDFSRRLPARQCTLQYEGAAKSSISLTSFYDCKATNQGVAGSNPASRSNFLVPYSRLSELTRSAVLVSARRSAFPRRARCGAPDSRRPSSGRVPPMPTTSSPPATRRIGLRGRAHARPGRCRRPDLRDPRPRRADDPARRGDPQRRLGAPMHCEVVVQVDRAARRL